MAVSYKILKYSALCQSSVGIFLMVLGCFDRSYMYKRYPTLAGLPLWMGFWAVVTGFFGMGVGYGRPDGPRIPILSRALGKTKTSNYLGLSIVSCILVGTMAVLYSHGMSLSSTCPEDGRQNTYCHISHRVGGIIILTAIIEFGVGVWACVCCCYTSSQRYLRQGQTVFIQNHHGQAAAHVIDIVNATGKTVVLCNPLDVLYNNPVEDQIRGFVLPVAVGGLWNDGFELGLPPPASEDTNEREGRSDSLPNTHVLED